MAGLCYVGTQLDQRGVQAIQGALFIFVTENTFSPMYSVLALFPQEMPLFMREHRSGLYSVSAYYLSKMVAMVSTLTDTKMLTYVTIPLANAVAAKNARCLYSVAKSTLSPPPD
jgi:hypothetical protein